MAVNSLATSENASTYFFNNLDDSLNVIRSQVDRISLAENDRNYLKSLIDSVSNNIYVTRLTHCIIGQTYSISEPYTNDDKRINKAIKENDSTNSHDSSSDVFAKALVKEMLTGQKITTIKIGAHNQCEIITSYDEDDFSKGLAVMSLGQYNYKKKGDSTGGTYSYLGNNEFRISNNWKVKVSNPQNCESSLVKE